MRAGGETYGVSEAGVSLAVVTLSLVAVTLPPEVAESPADDDEPELVAGGGGGAQPNVKVRRAAAAMGKMKATLFTGNILRRIGWRGDGKLTKAIC